MHKIYKTEIQVYKHENHDIPNVMLSSSRADPGSKCYIFKSCVLKSISSHSEFLVKMGGYPNLMLSHFLPILAILKKFASVLTFLGGKFFFCQSAPIMV